MYGDDGENVPIEAIKALRKAENVLRDHHHERLADQVRDLLNRVLDRLD